MTLPLEFLARGRRGWRDTRRPHRGPSCSWSGFGGVVRMIVGAGEHSDQA
jgi:hypothetical protein